MGINYQGLGKSLPPVGASIPAYVHIPFCTRRCWYCDFNVYERLNRLIEPYFTALTQEIESVGALLAGRVRLNTVYVGGGTPSLAGPERLTDLYATLTGALGGGDGMQATVEVNPSDTSLRLLEPLVEAGFSRVSIGVQSLVDDRLRALDRLHTAARALDAIELARRAGFSSISADLLYGAPEQTLGEWEAGLRGLVAAGVDHVSAYALTIRTPRAGRAGRRLGGVADDDAMARFYDSAVAILAQAGFDHYEVSNWSRPGHRCAYNVSVWRTGEYLAFGCGAHGHLGNRRFSIIRNPAAYIRAVQSGRSTVEWEELLDGEQRLLESIALSLRTSEGLDCGKLAGRFGYDLLLERADAVADLEREGLVTRQGNRLIPTDRGMFVANSLAAEFAPASGRGYPESPRILRP